MNDVHFKETQYGFEYGNAKVERMCSDKKKGWVTLRVQTDKEDLQIYVTKTGKVRIWADSSEWSKP